MRRSELEYRRLGRACFLSFPFLLLSSSRSKEKEKKGRSFRAIPFVFRKGSEGRLAGGKINGKPKETELFKRNGFVARLAARR